MRQAVCISLACLMLTFARADDPRLQQTVSFQEPAQTVGQILQKLSQQADLILFPVPPLDKEILIVDAKDLSLKILMDALADALDAEWFAQPNGSYRLTRTAKKAMERRQEDDSAIKAQLPRAIQESAKELKTVSWTRQFLEEQLRTARQILSNQLTDPEGRPAEERHTLFRQSRRLNPAQRLALRLLQQMNPQKLLDIPVGERRVFSNLQGRYLEPFGFDITPLLRQFAQEQSLLSEVWYDPKIGIDAVEKQYRERHEGYPSLLTDFWRDLPDRKPVSPASLRLFLEVARPTPESFSVRVYLEDPTTQRVYRGWHSFSARSELPPLPDGAWRERAVEWSEGTRLMAGAVSAYLAATEAELAQIRGEAVDESAVALRIDEARQRLLDPALTEPHSLMTTDLLRSYARAQGKALVAFPKEGDLLEVVRLCQAVLSGRDRLGMHARILQGYRWRERLGVLVATPPLVSYVWGTRFDRAGVSRVAMRVRQQGYLTLTDRLEWARAESPTFPYGEHWAAYGGTQQLRFSDQYAASTRLLNSFTERERSALLAGATIRLYEMSIATRNAVLHAVYYTETGSLRGERVHSVPLPHALFPNGLPIESAFQVQAANVDWAVPTTRHGSEQQLYLLLSQSPQGADGSQSSALDKIEVTVGTRTTYTLQLMLPDGRTTLSLGSVEAFRPSSEKPTRWRDLPATVRERIERFALTGSE
ncbi:MAG: hypothetical protein NZ874_09430 [Fimbriimonadales bacterium]|nr:hypothetical protein [Fimbriimonadales bacterium]